MCPYLKKGMPMYPQISICTTALYAKPKYLFIRICTYALYMPIAMIPHLNSPYMQQYTSISENLHF